MRASFRDFFFRRAITNFMERIMGRRGPKPEPAAIKQKKGSSRRRIGIDPDGEGGSARASIGAPAWLTKEGLDVWRRIAPRLTKMNLLTETDGETFARYCKNFARWLKMQHVLDKEGETYESESPHGKYKRAHPAYLIADRLERQLIAAEANFGLNPAERQRIFAARAAALAGGNPDLFGERAPSATSGDKPGARRASGDTAVGFLN